MERYIRNRLYISDSEQIKIRNFEILIAGAGIGSFIAEAALRLGFENLTIIDGDTVELSNLNRQNYQEKDLGHSKAISIKQRLLNINPNANIEILNEFITKDNIHSIIGNHNAAINALDFSSDIPFIFDSICQLKKIPVLHPYNIGWHALIYVISPDGRDLTYISKDYIQFEKNAVQYLLDNLVNHPEAKSHIENVLDKYKDENGIFPPPQLSAGSFSLAGSCTQILYNLAVQKEVIVFPKFYFLDIAG